MNAFGTISQVREVEGNMVRYERPEVRGIYRGCGLGVLRKLTATRTF